MNALNIIFRDIKTCSRKKWIKEHSGCYLKQIISNSEDGLIKSIHCLEHNQLFVLSYKNEANKKTGLTDKGDASVELNPDTKEGGLK